MEPASPSKTYPSVESRIYTEVDWLRGVADMKEQSFLEGKVVSYL
jgi:hypothetical protein